MAYSDFTLRSAEQAFALNIEERVSLFDEVVPVAPPENLREFLSKWAPVALATNTEKARSEILIAPILIAACELAPGPLSFFSGVTFDVDQERGLTGVCDYLLSQSSDLYFPSSPLISVVEAKKENIPQGLGQCLAEMVAAQEFNRSEGRERESILGVVTTGSAWRFLKLQGSDAWIDLPEYNLSELGRILGILTHIVQDT